MSPAASSTSSSRRRRSGSRTAPPRPPPGQPGHGRLVVAVVGQAARLARPGPTSAGGRRALCVGAGRPSTDGPFEAIERIGRPAARAAGRSVGPADAQAATDRTRSAAGIRPEWSREGRDVAPAHADAERARTANRGPVVSSSLGAAQPGCRLRARSCSQLSRPSRADRSTVDASSLRRSSVDSAVPGDSPGRR